MAIFRTKIETVLFVIPLLIASAEERDALLKEVRENPDDLDKINTALHAGKEAILRLPPTRQKELTVPECCVYMERGEDQGRKLLRQEFRGSGRYKEGRDFKLVKPVRIAKKGGDQSLAGGNRKGYWIHWLKPLDQWWSDHLKKDGRKKRNTRKADREAVLQAQIEELLADLEARGAKDLADARRNKIALLLDAQGFVLDCLTVPTMTPEAIADHLYHGTAAVAMLSLHEAITEHPWVSNEIRDPWHAIWHTLVERERAALAAMEQQANHQLATSRQRSIAKTVDQRQETAATVRSTRRSRG